MLGFYRSSYINSLNGQEEWLLTTQFEASEARRAFPCFDEPDMKAVFELTILTPSDYNAISNMPSKSETTLHTGEKKYEFLPSKTMSTYLVCYIVNKFEYISAVSSNNVTVRVWTPPGKKSEATYALQVATTVLTHYEQFFQTPYPLVKQDLIAIPDFAAGAMENWGLITFRETALLYSNVSSVNDKRRVAFVVSHELAHQWFGNLVTMNWWDDLWLNEGFASFVEYIGTDHAEPTWNIWELFLLFDTQDAFELDGLKSSHPISAKVTDPLEISQLFDSISYSKGASILRMLENYMNSVPGSFKTGLQSYLQKYSYKNAKTEQLWKSLEASSGLEIGNMMNTWTSQTGYPVVSFSEQSDGSYIITQSRFLYDKNSTEQDPSLWYIPLSFKIGKGGKTTFIEIKQQRSIVFTNTNSGTSPFILFNPGQIGFYRVNYPTKLRQNIVQSLNLDIDSLTVEEKVGFISDLFAMETAKLISPVEVLEAISFLKNERNLYVWHVTLVGLNKIRQKIQLAVSNFAKFDKFVLSLLEPLLSTSWDQKDDFISLTFKGSIFSTAAKYSHQPTIKKAQDLFENFKRDESTLPVDLRLSVYSIAVSTGGLEEYNYFLKRYMNISSTAAEKSKCLSAISSSPDPSIISYTLSIALNQSIIRSQDATRLISNVGSGGTLRAYLAWDFFQENHEYLYEKYESHMSFLEEVIGTITKQFTTKAKLDEVIVYFDKYPVKGAVNSVLQSIESIRSNIRWIENNKDLIV
eukprot:TRINITY_DN523_c1_g2_i1.p1 TRINITY_DN523_c1_g2~~TRINITY_DN523_c1_g2_i1.p1  ORF type:complete len:751 (-),score=149.65 TRINITY_DN523_c1_g2_i1:58-2310(-)